MSKLEPLSIKYYLDKKIRAGLKLFDKELPVVRIPKSLPLLSAFRKHKKSKSNLSLKNMEVLFIQHQLCPLWARLEAMLHDGYQKDNFWFIDIPYSTNRKVHKKIRKKYKSHCSDVFNDPLKPYSEAQLLRVEKTVKRLARRSSKRRVLVIDDGAYFIRVMSRLLDSDRNIFNSFRNRTHIVEQTTRGYRYLREKRYREVIKELGAPVVSIARCMTKKYFEAPFIGAAVARSAIKVLKRRGDLIDLGKVLVIGYGPVGKATFKALKKFKHKGKIDVIDIDTSKWKEVRKAGGRPGKKIRKNRKYNHVFGCTGYASFKWRDRHSLEDNAYLISGSSAAIEFNREKFLEIANRRPNDNIEILDAEKTRREGIKATIKIKDDERHSFSWVHAGFPVNFDSELEHVPVRLIQATHTLLYAAACQALNSKKPGMVHIDKENDTWILINALKQI